jgi:hypothetical protein
MVKLISYPFRLGINGSVVTIEEGEDYYGDELAMLIKTVPGERELVPTYGIQDPTFDKLSNYELLEKIAQFGPPVEVDTTSSRYTRDGRIVVNISYRETPIDAVQDLEDYYQNDDNDPYVDEDNAPVAAYDFTNDQDTLDGV